MPQLLTSGRGPIMNIASAYGLIGAPLALAYSATKGAIVNRTRQLPVDFSGQGVRVYAICPGYIDRARREAAAAWQPIGRQAQTDEVASVVVCLALDDGLFMTGSIVTVGDGCTFNHG